VFDRTSNPARRSSTWRRFGAGVFDTAPRGIGGLAIRANQSAAENVPEGRRMHYRIGVHLGDVMEKADGTAYETA
jgi:class 3 adenylate cyclase